MLIAHTRQTVLKGLNRNCTGFLQMVELFINEIGFGQENSK